MPIKCLLGRQILDSEGNPTIEVDLVTELGLFRAPVPSGVTESVYEPIELRDKIATDYHGLSVMNAVKYLNTVVGPELVKQGLEVTQQREIDNFLITIDGTENRSRLGANAIYGVSLAVCKAGAAKKGMPIYRHISDLAGNNNIIIPVPQFNVLVGGGLSNNKVAMRDFMIMPTGASSFSEAMKMGTEVYHHLRLMIIEKYGVDATTVSSEGGFCPNFESHREAFLFLSEAIKHAGYWGKVEIAIDAAASDFYKNGVYDMDFMNPQSNPNEYINPEKLIDVYVDFVKEYSVVSIEDPFEREDYVTWSKLVQKMSTQIVADELTVSRAMRVQNAVERRACTCVTLKLSQAGTISEAIDSFKLAKSGGMSTIVAARVGDVEDSFIADFVVGISAGQIRAGAPCHSERVGKYNQLLRIEEELGPAAKYAGKNYRNPI